MPKNRWITLTEDDGETRRYNLASMVDLEMRDNRWGTGVRLCGAYLMPRSKRVILHTYSVWENRQTHGVQGDGYMIASGETVAQLYRETGDERLLPLIPEGEY